jgi:hypothetical protein
MVRKILTSVCILTLLILSACAVFFGSYFSNVRHFVANPEKGYQADFYLYISPGAKKIAEEGGAITFLVQPNNSGINSDDPVVHQKDARWTGFERHKIANELNVALLVPAFIRPGQDWHIYTHALDRDVLTTQRKDVSRIDLQLLAMIDEARVQLKKEGINSNEKFLLQGFSASGMFANRFAVLHPERVLAVAVGSPGGWPIAPVKKYHGKQLPYPAGIGDLEILTGRSFDSTAFIHVPQLIVMGSADDNDSLDFTDGWDKDAAGIIDSLFGNNPLERWVHSESLYKMSGANVRFILVDGVGHDRKELQSHSTAFFKDILY